MSYLTSLDQQRLGLGDIFARSQEGVPTFLSPEIPAKDLAR